MVHRLRSNTPFQLKTPLVMTKNARFSCYCLIVLTFSVLTARADLVISEFMASSSSNSDFLDEDGNSSDWIEIHNNGDAPVDLDGYYLTDDPSDLEMWRFPARTLNGGEYLVVFASGNDRTEDEGELHSNFRLSVTGDYLALVQPDGTTVAHEYTPVYPEQFEDESFGLALPANLQQVTLIQEGADARWTVPTGEDDGWIAIDHDDSSWQSGKTGIGFGYDGLIGEGGDTKEAMRGVNASAWVRIPFEIANPAAVVTMTLRMKYEDGFVAFINGDTVAGANDPPELMWDSNATGSHSDSKAVVFEDYEIDFGGKIVAGTNVLAIQIMNSSAGGSDLLLIPELNVELRDLSQELVPGYLLEATPGAANSSGIAPGPLITEVTENPEQPDAGDELPITARVTEVEGGGVNDVRLVYRFMYEDEVTIPMADDGQGSDESAGDGVYSASIPGEVIQPGMMIRWKVQATDGGGEREQEPGFS